MKISTIRTLNAAQAQRVKATRAAFREAKGRGPFRLRRPSSAVGPLWSDMLPDDVVAARRYYSPSAEVLHKVYLRESLLARAHQLALAFVLGRSYADVERTTRSLPPLAEVETLLSNWGLLEGEGKTRFRVWTIEAARHLNVVLDPYTWPLKVLVCYTMKLRLMWQEVI